MWEIQGGMDGVGILLSIMMREARAGLCFAGVPLYPSRQVRGIMWDLCNIWILLGEQICVFRWRKPVTQSPWQYNVYSSTGRYQLCMIWWIDAVLNCERWNLRVRCAVCLFDEMKSPVPACQCSEICGFALFAVMYAWLYTIKKCLCVPLLCTTTHHYICYIMYVCSTVQGISVLQQSCAPNPSRKKYSYGTYIYICIIYLVCILLLNGQLLLAFTLPVVLVGGGGGICVV